MPWLTTEQKEYILKSTKINRITASELNIHVSTVSRVKRGEQYRSKKRGKRKIGKGGKMICPGCGQTDYKTQQKIVICKCGWIGDYGDLLFIKKMSLQGRNRLRENKWRKGIDIDK